MTQRTIQRVSENVHKHETPSDTRRNAKLESSSTAECRETEMGPVNAKVSQMQPGDAYLVLRDHFEVCRGLEAFNFRSVIHIVLSCFDHFFKKGVFKNSFAIGMSKCPFFFWSSADNVSGHPFAAK